jgi:hypothetical protein
LGEIAHDCGNEGGATGFAVKHGDRNGAGAGSLSPPTALRRKAMLRAIGIAVVIVVLLVLLMVFGLLDAIF